MGGSP